MDINLNVKVRGGKRTPVQVIVSSTSVNLRVIHFASGKTVSENTIAKWIETELTKALKKIEAEVEHGNR